MAPSCDLPEHSHVEIDGPSIIKACKHARKIVRVMERMNEIRDHSTELLYQLQCQQDMLRRRQEHLAESMTTTFERLLLLTTESDLFQTHSATTLSSFEQSAGELLQQTKDDLQAVQEQGMKVELLEIDTKVAEAEYQSWQGRLQSVGALFAQHASILPLYNEHDDESSVTSGNHSVPPRPTLVDEYYDKIGDLRILNERLADWQQSYDDEHIRRDLLIDQEQPVSVEHIRVFEEQYQRKQAELHRQRDAAVEEINRYRKICEEAGHNVDDYKAVSSDGNDNSTTNEESGSVIVAPIPWSNHEDNGHQMGGAVEQRHSPVTAPISIERWRNDIIDDRPLSPNSVTFRPPDIAI